MTADGVKITHTQLRWICADAQRRDAIGLQGLLLDAYGDSARHLLMPVMFHGGADGRQCAYCAVLLGWIPGDDETGMDAIISVDRDDWPKFEPVELPDEYFYDARRIMLKHLDMDAGRSPEHAALRDEWARLIAADEEAC